MSKKIFLLLSFLFVSKIVLFSQNIQLYYDFGNDLYKNDLSSKPSVRSTVEFFKMDKWGDTFFFLDMDYKKEGINSAYMEISRNLRFWQAPISLKVLYGGGLTSNFPFQHSVELGANYHIKSKDYSRILNISALYKYIHKNNFDHTFMITADWMVNMKKELFTFSGYLDFWREDKGYAKYILAIQPQFWVNLDKLKCVDDDLNLSIGCELDLGMNSHIGEGFYFVPALGAKWTF